MHLYFNLKLCVVFIWLQTIKSMSLLNKNSYFMDNSGSDSDIADLIISKGYLPNEKKLPQTPLIKNFENDVAYLLSKLSDEELIRLLNEQPKKDEYNLNDILKIAIGSKSVPESVLPDVSLDRPRETLRDALKIQNNVNKRFRTILQKEAPQEPYFKLENKPIQYNAKTGNNYAALQKLSSLLNSRILGQETKDKFVDDDDKRELLFDVLVAQLKSLCCKSNNSAKKHSTKNNQYKSLLSEFMSSNPQNELNVAQLIKEQVLHEHMFLIINDEIKSNGSEELISVDPESLEKNSSVLLLGPITTPLTDSQLKIVMTRIANELSKAEYLPLLKQISDGTLSSNNVRLMKSLVSGPETRRYIKPHRCNHQSKLARVYGGPKWLVCTGYLNLNAPSLYD